MSRVNSNYLDKISSKVIIDNKAEIIPKIKEVIQTSTTSFTINLSLVTLHYSLTDLISNLKH